MVNWIKKITCNTDLVSKRTTEHCNNFSTHCCLNCDKCWGKKYENNKK